MIKILTGYSGQGGSTFAFINLTNVLNKIGYPTIFYGPQDYHLKKCKYGRVLNEYKEEFNERLIVHFGDFKKRPEHAKLVILCCHEKGEYEVNDEKRFWDECVFLNEEHKKYHSNYTGPYRIIPNLRQKIKKIEKSPEAKKCAGVIGNIDKNKQTHISIQRALDDGYEKVYLFGKVSDKYVDYDQTFVKPIIEKYPNQVIRKGFLENKSEMYAMIDAAYLSSISEVAPLVRDECETTGTIFRGVESCYGATTLMSNTKIINAWIDVLGLKKL